MENLILGSLRMDPEAMLKKALERYSNYGGRRIIKRPILPLSSPLFAGAATSVHRVKISLHGAKPPAWRRIEFPSAMTLKTLHEVIQAAFGWHELHMHAFQTMYGEFGDPGHSDDLLKLGDESAVALAQVATRDKVFYVYDFRDEWRHDIAVEAIEPAAPGVAYPRCVKGRGTAPGEGSGGIEAWNQANASGGSPAGPFDPDPVTRAIAHLATVITPA